jgi:hypothetical protein
MWIPFTEFMPEPRVEMFGLCLCLYRGEIRVLFGWEWRRNFAANHPTMPGCGGAIGVVVFGMWLGFVKVRE